MAIKLDLLEVENIYNKDGEQTLNLTGDQGIVVSGTIGSGAITSTGQITGTELEGTSLDINGNADISGNLTGVDTLTATTFSGDLNGTINTATTATTQSASNNSTKVATTAYVDAQVATIVDSAPGTLNTLNELAAALGDDASFSTTVTDSIATKLPLAGGTMTGAIAMGSNNITGGGTITGTTLTGTSLDINGAGDVSGTLTVDRLDVAEYLYHEDDNTYIRFLPDRIIAVASNNTVLNLNVGADTIEFGHTGKPTTLQGSSLAFTGAATFNSTIGSGAITSTGKITGTELEGTSLDINGNADISGALTLGTALAVAEGGTGATNLNALVQTTGSQTIGGAKTFTSDITISDTYPKLFLTDTDSNDDWSIINNNGDFYIYNETDSKEFFRADEDSEAMQLGDGIDMTYDNIGTSNNGTVVRGGFLNPAAEANMVHLPHLINDLAGFNKWSNGTITVSGLYGTRSGSSGSYSYSNAIANDNSGWGNAFDSHSSTAGSWYSDNGTDGVYQHGTDTPGVITLEWPNEATYSLWVGIVFGSVSFSPTYVKIEAYRGGAWQTECEIDDNNKNVVLRQVASNSGTGSATTKLRYTLGGSVNGSYFRIHSLYMANYRAGDNNLNNTGTDTTRGVNFLERYKDGYLHGNLYPGADDTYDIGSSSYKFKDLYLQGTVTTTNHGTSSHWNTAYGWGNHASAGYLTSYSETDTLDNVADRGATTNQSLTVGGLITTGTIKGPGTWNIYSEYTNRGRIDLLSSNANSNTVQVAFLTDGNQRLTIAKGGTVNVAGDMTVGGTVDGIDIATDVAANTAKTGITSGQASAITANTAKTGITSGQASAITANTAKTTFPGFGTSSSTALAGDTSIPSISGLATLASPTLTGTPLAPTAAANTNTTQIATTAYVQAELTDLIGGAPGTLDTLNELAAAIDDDASYASTLTTALALKAPKASPTFTGTVTIPNITNVETAITANTAKTGITSGQASAITANTSKISYNSAASTKLGTIETSADVTDATNVAAAGAVMDSEVTNLTQVKAFDTTDYATAAQGSTADSALQSLSGAVLTTGDQTIAGEKTFTGALTVNLNGDALNLRSTTNGQPANITFSTNVPDSQVGHIKYNHSNNASYGGGDSFTIGGTETTTVILADGQLMYKDGIYSKPATGTGAGVRKDANWDTAYTHSQAAHAPSNAEQNVQSDWNATSGDAFIDNKPTIPAAEAYTEHESITQATTNLDNSGRTYIQDITLDSNGHVTAVGVATETVTDTTYTVGNGGLTQNNLTNALKTSYDGAVTHAATSHAPSGATVNSADATLLGRANHTGTQAASTISDFDTEVANNSAVEANTAKTSNIVQTTVTGNAGTVTNGVYTTGTQTIGGAKTFSIAITGNITGNAGTATKIASITNENIVQLTEIQTLTNKTLYRPEIQVYAAFNGGTSGVTYLNATAVAGSTTLTLPAATDTLVGRATTDTLTNKTLTAPTITGAGSIAGVFTGNITGNVTGNADTVTTNANLTGPVTSSGNATAIADGAITTAMQKHLQTFEFNGYIPSAASTNYFIPAVISTNTGPFKHDVNAGADGTTAIAPSTLLRTGGQVMLYDGTCKLWKGWVGVSGTSAFKVSIFKYTPTANNSTNASLVLVKEFTGTAAGNSNLIAIDLTTGFTTFSAGDILITAVSCEATKSLYFTSNLEVEWN